MNISLINPSVGYNTVNFEEFLGLEQNSCDAIIFSNVLDNFQKVEIEQLIDLATKKLKDGGEVVVEQNDLHEAAIYLISGRLSVEKFNNMFTNKKYVPSIQHIENLLIRSKAKVSSKDIDNLKFIITAKKHAN